MPSRPRILVIGSANMDVVLQAQRLPGPGETVLGDRMTTAAGGKGANQAVAAARLGAQASFVGCIGRDAWGEELRARLIEDGVDVSLLRCDPEHATGTAFILVEPGGRNRIVVLPGANLALSSADVDAALEEGQVWDALLVQLEVDVETSLYAIERGRARGIPVVLDAGPARRLHLERLAGLTILTPNESEASALTSIEIRGVEDARRAAQVLEERTGAQHVVLKLGERGALVRRGGRYELVEAFRVQAVDTTAAGDAFTAALALKHCEGAPIENAVRYANAAGAIAVTRLGAQPSLPGAEEVEELLAARSSSTAR
jgi:ribokinase